MSAQKVYEAGIEELYEHCYTNYGLTRYGCWLQGLLDQTLEKVGPEASSETFYKAYDELWDSFTEEEKYNV